MCLKVEGGPAAAGGGRLRKPFGPKIRKLSRSKDTIRKPVRSIILTHRTHDIFHAASIIWRELRTRTPIRMAGTFLPTPHKKLQKASDDTWMCWWLK